MEERSGESEDQGFLPPEPAGPEPELGDRPSQVPPPPQPQPQPQAPQQYQQPAQTYGYPPPPPGYGYPPPPPGQAYPPPPGYGYQPPPPGQAYPPAWGYPQPPVPDNGPAVAGFVFSLVSAGLLVISGGLSSIVSIACAIVGIVYSRKGKQKVDAGETPKHRGLAQAGFIIGWVSLFLAVLATIAWTLVIVLAITDDNFNFDDSQTIRVTAVAVRAGAHLLGA